MEGKNIQIGFSRPEQTEGTKGRKGKVNPYCIREEGGGQIEPWDAKII